MMVVRASPVPLYIQIDEELRGQIESGELGPLDQVPSEAELSERFHVSRMTARKALDRLVGDGMLFRKPGKGTFVAPLKLAHQPSQGLSFSAAMRAQGEAVHTEVLEATTVRAPLSVARALNLASGAQVVFLRRLRRVGDIPAAIHLSYLPGRLSAVLDHDLSGSLSDLMATVGARVDRSEDYVEAVAATGEDAKLLGLPSGSPLVFIHGVAYSATNEPVRYSEALYPGHRWTFRVENTRDADLRPQFRDGSSDA
jgi:GntR family transcriptional regulator